MGLLAFFRKKKKESSPEDGGFCSRAEEDSHSVRTRDKRNSDRARNRSGEPFDPVLPEKKRARRRLVGAIALVLALVIGLPMILDSEPKPIAGDVVIQIPSKDKPLASIRRESVPTPVSKVAASAALDPKEEIVSPARLQMVTVGDHAGPLKPLATGKEVINPVNAQVSLPTSAIKPGEVSSPVGNGKIQPSKDTSTLLPRPGAVSDLKRMPRSDGTPEIPAVHAKPAEQVKDALRAQEILDGKADSRPTSARLAVGSKPGRFMVQVAALATQEKVNDLQAKLKDSGIESSTQKVATQSGERIRVRVGPFFSKTEADKMRTKLIKLGLNGTVLPT